VHLAVRRIILTPILPTSMKSLAAILLCLASCSTFKAASEHAKPAAAGGVVGAALMPLGVLPVGLGVFVTVFAVQAITENGELRDGTLTGEDAKAKEIVELRQALGDKTARLERVSHPSWLDQIREYWNVAAWALGALIAVNLFIIPRGREGLAHRWAELRSKEGLGAVLVGMVAFMLGAVFMALGLAHSRSTPAATSGGSSDAPPKVT